MVKPLNPSLKVLGSRWMVRAGYGHNLAIKSGDQSKGIPSRDGGGLDFSRGET